MDVAAFLHITAEAARRQLVRLAADGLVETELEPNSRGRPSRRWRLTRAGHSWFRDGHAELTVRLLSAMRHELGEAALERVIATREAEMRHAYREALRGAAPIGSPP
jgi:predicted ArsR family transcriptional regulator